MPTIKKNGSVSRIMPSLDEMRSFLDTLQIEAIQLSQIEGRQLDEKVSATRKTHFFNRNKSLLQERPKQKFWEQEWHKALHHWFIIRLWIEQIRVEEPDSVEAIALLMQKYNDMSEEEPVKLSYGTWIFKEFCYSVNGPYSDEQFDTVVKILGHVHPLRTWCNA